MTSVWNEYLRLSRDRDGTARLEICRHEVLAEWEEDEDGELLPLPDEIDGKQVVGIEERVHRWRRASVWRRRKPNVFRCRPRRRDPLGGVLNASSRRLNLFKSFAKQWKDQRRPNGAASMPNRTAWLVLASEWPPWVYRTWKTAASANSRHDNCT